MGLTDRVTNAWKAISARDTWPTISWDDYFSMLSFNGNNYLAGGLNQTIKGNAEEIDASFAGLVQSAYKANGVVFACMLARMTLFAEARFQFQELRNGRPGALFGAKSLDILEHPWTTGTTGDLLARALQDADLGGTAFHTRRRSGIRRMRPDWVTIVLGSEDDPDVQAGDIDADVLGVIYHPGGKQAGRDPVAILRENLSIFAPIPDPLASFRGMSPLTPIIREIAADKQMTEHKQAYLINGATPNLVVSLDKDSTAAANPAAFKEWIEAFQKLNPTGSQWDRYKTMYLAGGTTVSKVGGDLGSTGVDFKQVQGAGETRIAAAFGVPPVIVGLSEGLQAATYSNYGQARRRFADNTMRPLWRNIAGSLETLVPPPPGSRLWYDDRDIQALAEDKKDLAEVRQLESQQMRSLVDGGFTPESVIEAVTTGDWTRLTHTGLFSVQLQPPQPDGPPAPPPVIAPPRHTELEAYAYQRDMVRTLAAIATREQPIPQITVTPPDVHVAAVDMTELADAIREIAARETAPPIVNIAGLHVEPPTVNVAPAEVHVDAPVIHLDPLSDETVKALTTREVPVVNVAMPARLTVDIGSAPGDRPKRTRITKRDGQGRPTESVTEEIE